VKILLVQTSFPGDIVLSTPVIAGIKKKYPESQLWVLTTKIGAEILSADPFLKGIIVYDKRNSDRGFLAFYRKIIEIKSHDFQIVFSLHKSFRSSLLLWLSQIPNRVGFKKAKFSFLYQDKMDRPIGEHDVIRNMSILGLASQFSESDFDLRLCIPKNIDSASILEKFGISKPYAVLAPGSVWKTKMWNWKKYQELGNLLKNKLDLSVVVLGSKDDFKVSQKVCENTSLINVVGRTNILEFLVIIKEAKVLICNDSMPLHVASSFKTPAVAIFCATSPSFGFGPWRNKAIVIEREGLSCKPCSAHGANKCPTGTELCMTDVSAESALRGVMRVCDL